MVEYPATLVNAKDVAGVLRRLYDSYSWEGKPPFRFQTVERGIKEIMRDYPDPYEVALVLIAEVEQHPEMLEEAWNTLDIRAFGRLRGWITNLPDGAAQYIYLASYVADYDTWANCYPTLGDLEDAADAGYYDAARAALEKLKELLGSYKNPA